MIHNTPIPRGVPRGRLPRGWSPPGSWVIPKSTSWWEPPGGKTVPRSPLVKAYLAGSGPTYQTFPAVTPGWASEDCAVHSVMGFALSLPLVVAWLGLG